MMTRTFEEMCAERDPLYAAMRPVGNFGAAAWADKDMVTSIRLGFNALAAVTRLERDALLLKLAIRSLRNQGQPCYDAR